VFFSYRRSHKACRTFEFAFRLEPILKLTSWQAGALLVNFVSAAAAEGMRIVQVFSATFLCVH
jgi:hypothetical protein